LSQNAIKDNESLSPNEYTITRWSEMGLRTSSYKFVIVIALWRFLEKEKGEGLTLFLKF